MNIAKTMILLSGLPFTVRRIRVLYFMTLAFYRIYRAQGAKGLTLYLKTSAVSMQQALGGYKVSDTRKVGKGRIARTHSGMPRIIPADIRRLILARDPRAMKFALSILNLFRDLQ